MKNLKLDLLSKEEAEFVGAFLNGYPTMDRVLVATVGKENTTSTGIILPKTEENSIPKVAVIVKIGDISEDYRWPYERVLGVGKKIYYGIYGGKIIEPGLDKEKLMAYDGPLSNIKDKLLAGEYEFSVLSVNEILYLE